MSLAGHELLGNLLKEVSRSFYLTLRVLPGAIRPQIGLAYLLARATDTVADTKLVPVQARLDALQQLRVRILGESSARLDFGTLAGNQGTPAERVLLERIEAALGLLNDLTAEDLQLVRSVLVIITSGQELDLQRFGSASAQNVRALLSAAELDDYTFRVAGCVGEFWTRMCCAHLYANRKSDDAQLVADGIRFGKGLQLVNILRDLPRDLQEGRCYLPEPDLASIQLRPLDLLTPANESKLRPVYNRYLKQAEEHLSVGWRYTNSLPRNSARVRLACAWPILIGVQTLQLLHQERALDPAHRVKISRSQVRSILWRSVALYPFPGAWKRLCPLSDPR
jgi:farnesyl-diphosphate farnesyltransferase